MDWIPVRLQNFCEEEERAQQHCGGWHGPACLVRQHQPVHSSAADSWGCAAAILRLSCPIKLIGLQYVLSVYQHVLLPCLRITRAAVC